MMHSALIKYVYFDVVAFTKDRSVEAQSDIIKNLNTAVEQSLSAMAIPEEQRILLPTGDGICIALVNAVDPVDIHVRLSCDLIHRIAELHGGDQDMRRFQVRVGVNENVDNIVTDINGNRNVAGLGVNMAQRIMSQGDGNQIMVGSAVYEVLKQREIYMSAFRYYTGRGKHGLSFPVFQLVLDNVPGLNLEIPQQFRKPPKQLPQLDDLAAHYIAIGAEHQEYLMRKSADPSFDYAAVVLLYFMAYDAAETRNQKEYDPHKPKTWGSQSKTIDEQYAYYYNIDFWVTAKLSGFIIETHLEKHWECFQGPSYQPKYALISKMGLERLKTQRPDLWKDYELDKQYPEG